MLFYQKHTYNEYQFGQQTVMFAVSDSYSEIFSLSDGVETDIFSVGSLKQDLNLSESKFAIDELDFSINQATCKSDNDRNALAFTLECKDKFRVCAVFFMKEGEVPSNENLLFIGSLNNKVSGDDLYWSSLPFGTLINPIREYKFSALSLDISLLEKCKFSGNNYNQNSARVNNIYERIRANNDVLIEALNEGNLFSHIESGGNLGKMINYYITLGKLSKAIELYLSKASEMIYDLTEMNIGFVLEESDLGLQFSPIQYGLSADKKVIYDQYVYNNSFYNLGLNWESGRGDFYQEPLIDLRIVHANYMRDLGDWNDKDSEDEINTERGLNARAMYGTEKAFSFEKLNNVSELIFEIARAFACYLTTRYSLSTNGELIIYFKFLPRTNLISDSKAYILGASDASFDTSAIVSNESNKFYSIANNTASDGTSIVKITNKGESINWGISDELKRANELRSEETRQNDTKYQRLLLSTSQTLLDLGNNVHIPVNTFVGFPPNKDMIFLTTALFAKTHILEAEQRGLLAQYGENISSCHRPIGKVYTTIDGKAVSDECGDGVQLADYVNRTLSHEKTYFETEYELTVPYWNGFSKSGGGFDCKWQNVRLGTIIELNEDIRVLVNGQWQIFRPSKGTSFVVVGKELSLSGIETKLKLQNSDRYAYNTYYTGKEGEFLAPKKSTFWSKPTVMLKDYSQYKSAEIKPGENILIGDAVIFDNSIRKVFKAVAKSEYYDFEFGIAKEIVGNICYYQDSGVIECYAFNFDTEKLVFVRTAPDSNSLNISQNYLTTKTDTEDMAIWLGKPKTNKSFVWNFKNAGKR